MKNTSAMHGLTLFFIHWSHDHMYYISIVYETVAVLSSCHPHRNCCVMTGFVFFCQDELLSCLAIMQHNGRASPR